MAMDVGSHLRNVRKMYRLSQRELARRAGVTNGTISLIEQNRVSPSVSSLRKVLAGIPMTLADFFAFEPTPACTAFYRQDELLDIGNADVSLCLVASARKDRRMAILHETYPAGADTGEDMLVHEGEEGGVVVRGEIEVTAGNETRVLQAGEAYYFDSSLPHRFRNPGSSRCEIVSASSPPTF